MLGYNLRFCLDTSADEAEEAAQQAAAVAAGGAEAGEQHQQQQQRARGMPTEPPLRFRPAVHRACTFPVRAVVGVLKEMTHCVGLPCDC